MSHPRKFARIALLGALGAALAMPAQALAEYYIPPGNSAANQYTEAYPTAGGDSGGKQGADKGRATPADTLGARNAERLESKGQTGTEAAVVAAETAPPPVVETSGSEAQGQQGGPGGGGDKGSRQPSGGTGGDTAANQTAPAESPSGSSAFGEVVAQATGSADDGNLGLLLPIVILATVAGSIAYLARRHQSGPTA